MRLLLCNIMMTICCRFCFSCCCCCCCTFCGLCLLSTWKDDRKFTEATRKREKTSKTKQNCEKSWAKTLWFSRQKSLLSFLLPPLPLSLLLPPPTFNSFIFVANFWHFSWTTFSACLFSCHERSRKKYFFEISFHFIFFFSSPLKRFFLLACFLCAGHALARNWQQQQQ